MLKRTQLEPFSGFRCVRSGGGRGIRTPVGFRPNGFQDRLVMTASIYLQGYISVSHFKKIVKRIAGKVSAFCRKARRKFSEYVDSKGLIVVYFFIIYRLAERCKTRLRIPFEMPRKGKAVLRIKGQNPPVDSI